MIFEKTLKNGLDLVIQPTAAPVAAIQVWVDVGSIDEKPQEAGFCHFLEHMLFKGTKKRTTASIAGAVEGSGGDMNAFTSFEYTVYHITLSNQRWELANDILADMVLGSVFLPKEFNPEKEVILEEIKRGEDSPDRRLYRGVYEQMYGGSGYGKPVIGFPRTVKACSASTLKSFWKKWYSPELMTVVVCGDVDIGKVVNKVEATWGKASGRALRSRRRTVGVDQQIKNPKSFQASQEFSVNSVRWVGALPSLKLRDSGLAALDIAGMVLGQGETSRLYSKVFREKQLVSSISAGCWAPLGRGLFTFDVEVSTEKANGFRESLFSEVDRFCLEGPTTEEMKRAITGIESERIYGQQNMEGLASRLGFLKTSIGNVSHDLEYMNEAKSLEPRDVRDAARAILKLDELREFALTPKGFEVSKIFGTGLARPKAAAWSGEKRGNGIEKLSLPNGIDLVLCPRDDIPVVSLQACALGGLRAETNANAGIGGMLSEVWEKGPAGWTSAKLAEFFEDRASRLDSFSGRNSLGLSATTLTKHMDEVLPVFIDTLFNPALDETEFQHAKALALDDIKTMEDEPGRFVSRIFCESIFEGHPYAMPIIGYADSVSSLSRNALEAHFQKLMKNERVVVSICGKFSRDKTVAAFERIKRTPAGKGSLSKVLDLKTPKAPRVVEAKKGREQNHLIVGFQGTRVTDSERYDLRVLSTVLSGQSGRLFRELRDKKGLCYTVTPINFEGLEPGYFGVYMGCDPSKREEALKGIGDELAKTVEKMISPAEFRRAKEFILGRHHMDLQMTSAVATAAAFGCLYGLGHDDHLKLAGGLKETSPQSIQKLARRLFESPSITALVV